MPPLEPETVESVLRPLRALSLVRERNNFGGRSRGCEVCLLCRPLVLPVGALRRAAMGVKGGRKSYLTVSSEVNVARHSLSAEENLKWSGMVGTGGISRPAVWVVRTA